MGAGTDPNVLVVGAEPTGLLSAAEPHRRGVPCLLVDAHPAQPLGPRFCCPSPVARAVRVARPRRPVPRRRHAAARPHAPLPWRGARVGWRRARAGSRYAYDIGLSEEVTERILTTYLTDQGGAVTRGSKLVALTAGADSVRAELERNGEVHEVEVAWVIGCDGLHSPTRGAIGVEYDGHDIPEPWAVFDATVVEWPEAYDVTSVYLDPPSVILTPLPDRRWRVYLRPSSPDSDLVSDATGTLTTYYPDVSFVEVENPVRFQCHSDVAQRFRSGRVLLAGDAAHLCSPAQGRGMNTGL